MFFENLKFEWNLHDLHWIVMMFNENQYGFIEIVLWFLYSMFLILTLLLSVLSSSFSHSFRMILLLLRCVLSWLASAWFSGLFPDRMGFCWLPKLACWLLWLWSLRYRFFAWVTAFCAVVRLRHSLVEWLFMLHITHFLSLSLKFQASSDDGSRIRQFASIISFQYVH